MLASYRSNFIGGAWVESADGRVDTVVVNTNGPTRYPQELLSRYGASGAEPVEPDVETLRTLVSRVITGEFASTKTLIRHDAERVLLALWPELAQ